MKKKILIVAGFAVFLIMVYGFTNSKLAESEVQAIGVNVPRGTAVEENPVTPYVDKDILTKSQAVSIIEYTSKDKNNRIADTIVGISNETFPQAKREKYVQYLIDNADKQAVVEFAKSIEGNFDDQEIKSALHYLVKRIVQ